MKTRLKWTAESFDDYVDAGIAGSVKVTVWQVKCGNTVIARFDHENCPNVKERERRARLIAAAPALHCALKDCADYLAEFMGEGRELRVIQAADAALASAESVAS